MYSLAGVRSISGRGDCGRTYQRTKTFPQTGACHAPEATGTDSPTQTVSLLCGRFRDPPGVDSLNLLEIEPVPIGLALQVGRPALGGNEKSLKKVLTLKREIQYHGARFQKR